MTDFDAYHEFLGIPPKDQPPNHYRLLGIEKFEDSYSVIARSVDRQMAYLRSIKTSEHVGDAQHILNHLAQASVILLDAERKAAYDEHLQVSDGGGEVGEAAMVFGEYELIDLIGQGLTGQVFKAQHASMERVVAIKVLASKFSESKEMVERFRRKVQILAKLHHPNLVTAYDAGEQEGVNYLVMEYVDGDDLVNVMKQHHPLPIGHVAGYISQAAAGLGYAHANGVVHRNVKPSNLMVDGAAVVKVIGLGLAKVDAQAASQLEQKDLTRSGRVFGSYDYISPEQSISSDDVTHLTDIYALGCTMFTLLAGRTVFSGSDVDKIKAHRLQPPPSISEFRPDAPIELDQVFHWMVAKRPEDRYQSMNDVIAALQPF